MSTPKFTAEQLLTALAVFSTNSSDTATFYVSTEDAASLVAHFREQANTLRSTQEALALCQRAYQEERERIDWLCAGGAYFVSQHVNEMTRELIDSARMASANAARAIESDSTCRSACAKWEYCQNNQLSWPGLSANCFQAIAARKEGA